MKDWNLNLINAYISEGYIILEVKKTIHSRHKHLTRYYLLMKLDLMICCQRTHIYMYLLILLLTEKVISNTDRNMADWSDTKYWQSTVIPFATATHGQAYVRFQVHLYNEISVSFQIERNSIVFTIFFWSWTKLNSVWFIWAIWNSQYDCIPLNL